MALADEDTNSIIADNNHCEDVACGWCWWGRGEAMFIFSLNLEAQLLL